MGSAGLANDAASAGDDGSAGDACFCQFLLMILAAGFDAGSAGVFCWGCLFLPVFANDAGFWFDAGSAGFFCW